jgi:hypothetical protein
MSVNQMRIEDVYEILNSIHDQTALGMPVSGIDTSAFVSVANTMLQQNTDVVYNALMNTIAKTVFSTRPYSRQFGGMIVDNLKWGGIVRKIQFGDTDAVADLAFHDIEDGQSVDHYVVNKGDVIETRYYGSTVYQDVMTVFRDQLVNAFSGPEQLGSFIAAKANEVNNKWVQWTEDLARGLIINAIFAVTGQYGYRSGCVLHLISMYNDDTGSNVTIDDVKAGANAKPFWEYVRAKIRTIQRLFTNRNTAGIGGLIENHNFVRHTPYNKQKVYLLAPYMDLMETSTLSEAFHNDMLKYSDYEGVSYWQSFKKIADSNDFEFDKVAALKYVYLTDTGAYQDVTTGTDASNPATREHVLGLIFDEDMMNINIRDTIIQNTPMNAQGLYYNTWLTAHAQYCQDFTEKCCVLLLD